MHGGLVTKEKKLFLLLLLKDGNICVDPSPYIINLLIAYDENTFVTFVKKRVMTA